MNNPPKMKIEDMVKGLRLGVKSANKKVHKLKLKCDTYRLAVEKRHKQNILDGKFKSLVRKKDPKLYDEVVKELRGE